MSTLIAICAFALCATGYASAPSDVVLFAPPAEVSVSLFPSEPVCLFKAVPPAEVCLFGDFSRNQSVSAAPEDFRIAAKPEEQSKACTPAQTKPDTRPYMVCYGPDFCGLCPPMFAKVGQGNDQVRIRCVKGAVSSFPKYIQDYGNEHGWPVEHWVTPSGKYGLTSGAKSIEQLVELVRKEPDQVLAR